MRELAGTATNVQDAGVPVSSCSQERERERASRTDHKNANNKTFAKHRLVLYDLGGGEDRVKGLLRRREGNGGRGDGKSGVSIVPCVPAILFAYYFISRWLRRVSNSRSYLREGERERRREKKHEIYFYMWNLVLIIISENNEICESASATKKRNGRWAERWNDIANANRKLFDGFL